MLGNRDILRKYPNAKIIAVPGRDTNFYKRRQIISSLGVNPARWAALIHPNVILAKDAKLGYNTVLMPGCVISVGVSIGNHCLFLANSVVSHDSCVGDYTLVGSGVSISGSVNIGDSCYIGSGSKIIQEIMIGNGALVGIGSVVIRPVQKETVVAGCPAKIIKSVNMHKQISRRN